VCGQVGQRARAGRLALATLLFVLPPGAAFGAPTEKLSGRVALVVSYRCRPDSRRAFREHLVSSGLPSLRAWEAAGAFVEHLLLFNVDVNEDAWDALLVLRFEDWGQYGRWKGIERTSPAALSADGLRLVTGVSSALSELAWQGRRPDAPGSREKPVYFVRPYYYDDKPAYRRFFEAYNRPQFDAWLRAGAISSYRALLNQNPTGDTWGVLVIYEYPGWEAANARDSVKDAVAPELSAIPGWDLLGEVKGQIRRSGRVTLAERLP
jgi:hypothetical protein